MGLRTGTGKIGNTFSLRSESPKSKHGKEAKGPRLTSAVGSEPEQTQARAPQRLAMRNEGAHGISRGPTKNSNTH